VEGRGCLRDRVNAWGPQKRYIAGRLAAFLAALACLTLAADRAPAQTETKNEYRVKAQYLANLSKFVEWPEKTFPSEDTPFVIGVVGNYPFGPWLLQAVAGQTVRGRKIEVRWLTGQKTREDFRRCQILFSTAGELKRISQILGAVQGANVLLVGESEGFLQAGGTINFVLENDRVRFEINADAAARAELKLSSQLLALARNTPGNPGAPKS
jgi:hypothetical protein